MVQQLTVRNLSPALGAEIEGFDPLADIDAETWHLLSRTFDDRGFLVFRDMREIHAPSGLLAKVGGPTHGEES